MPIRFLTPLTAFGLAIALTAPALAAAKKPEAPAQSRQSPGETQPERLGGSQNWNAYFYVAKAGKVCYLAGHPSKSEPASLKRNDVDALVTHRPAEKTTNVVSFVAGYLFKEGSDAELEVDGQKFNLFTDKDTAWARDAATDKAIVAAMTKGRSLVIKGNSIRGSSTTDIYTLAGFGEALALIDKACGVKR
jgi:hypothetical protein